MAARDCQVLLEIYQQTIEAFPVKDMFESVDVCMVLCTWVCMDMRGYVWIYVGIYGYT